MGTSRDRGCEQTSLGGGRCLGEPSSLFEDEAQGENHTRRVLGAFSPSPADHPLDLTWQVNVPAPTQGGFLKIPFTQKG